MVSNIGAILIIGGTSGIGEGFTRRFHAMGKSVIITGRRVELLDKLKDELKGLETRKMDVSNLSALPKDVDELLKSFPDIDSVFLVAGQQQSFSFFDQSTSSDSKIEQEVTTNLTSPLILTRLFMPHLIARASASKPANLFLVSSGLAFVPLGFYPVYCPTKAAIHSFSITLRQQLAFAPEEIKKHLSIVEIVPPYVDTGLDAAHRESVDAAIGEQAPKPMALEEYLDKTLASLQEPGPDGKFQKEVGTGFSQIGIDTWRGSVGKYLKSIGIDA